MKQTKQDCFVVGNIHVVAHCPATQTAPTSCDIYNAKLNFIQFAYLFVAIGYAAIYRESLREERSP
jgi:hypothetical protein